MLLANLLPGLRELRAPLAAGYTLLVAAFVFTGGRIGSDGTVTGALSWLDPISRVIGTSGLLAALTFAAYILGSLVVDAARPFFDAFGDAMSDGGEGTLFDVARRACDRAVPPNAVSDDELVKGAREAIDRTVPASLRNRAPARPARTSFARLVAAAAHVARTTPDEIFADCCLPGEEPAGSAGLSVPPEPRDRVACVLANHVYAELDLVEMRLLGRDPELYGLVDRLRSEAELRQGLTLPSALLALALAVRVSWLLGLAVFLIALLLPPQSGRRRRAANDLLADALLLRRIRAPTLERLLQVSGIDPTTEDVDPAARPS